MIEGALRENGGLRVSHGLVRDWVAEGVPARLLILENVAPDSPMLVPHPDVPWRFASAKVRRFRTAVPFVVWGMVTSCWRADIVISGSEVGWQLPLGRVVTWLARRPFVTLVQAPLTQAIDAWDPARARPLLRWTHRHVDQAVCVAPGLVSQVEANGLPRRRIAVVPVGIDVDDVVRRGRDPSRSARRAVVATDPSGEGERGSRTAPILLAMGRLSAAKGFDVLIAASARLRAEGIDHRILIVGEGPDRARLEEAIAAAGLTGTVALLGFVAEPQPLLATADLFVLSSRHEGNGGLVLIEALAHARPVIATDCETGPREMLRDGALGDLVPPEDPAALAAAIARHLRAPDRLAAKAAQGPARAREFDQRDTARRLLALLRQTPTSRPGARRPGRHRRSAARLH